MDLRLLNRRVTIQAPSTELDEIGQPKPEWVLFGSAWASIRYLNGLETIKAGVESSTAKVSIRIRYRADITAAMQIVSGSVLYRINAVLPDEARHEYVDLSCEVIA